MAVFDLAGVRIDVLMFSLKYEPDIHGAVTSRAVFKSLQQ
jgi:hypothetical protein